MRFISSLLVGYFFTAQNGSVTLHEMFNLSAMMHERSGVAKFSGHVWLWGGEEHSYSSQCQSDVSTASSSSAVAYIGIVNASWGVKYK